MGAFLVFRLDRLNVALRAATIDRVVHAVDITPLPKAPDITLGVINIRGRLIPVVDLRKRFGLPARNVALNDRFVIARTPKRHLAVVTDTVDGVFEYPEASITDPAEVLSEMEYVAGVVRRKDGILFIHDLDTFLSSKEAISLDRALANSHREQGNEDAP